MRGRVPLAATVAVLLVAGCTAGRREPPAPAATTTTPPTTTPPPTTAPPAACPTPPPATTAPTDFPHPVLTRHPATTPESAADTALARQGLAALGAFGGPVSTSAFQHFLDAGGGFLTLPVDGLLTANPALVAELDTTLVRTVAGAVTHASTVAPCTTIGFTSGWLPHDDVADPDWHYTLGRFWFQVLGTATRETTGVRVTYRLAVGDTYDFDPGSTFAEFEQLALDGHAADFLDGGLTTTRQASVTSAAGLASPGFG